MREILRIIIDRVINTLLGGLTLDPAGMHCPSWDDAFVSSSVFVFFQFFLCVLVILSVRYYVNK